MLAVSVNGSPTATRLRRCAGAVALEHGTISTANAPSLSLRTTPTAPSSSALSGATLLCSCGSGVTLCAEASMACCRLASPGAHATASTLNSTSNVCVAPGARVVSVTVHTLGTASLRSVRG